MGDIGLISRLFCIKLGSFMTYASLKEQTANGQVNIETIQRIYKLLLS
ncbi:MAG: type I 3-dehydroquinate dehydratase [Candidatus Thorarchaeota archaeon]